MNTLFAMAFARALDDALEHAGWAADPPHASGRWSYAPLGLTARVLTERSVSVRAEHRPGDVSLVRSGMSNPVHAALHVARQLHALRVAAQAEADALKQGGGASRA